MYMRQTLPHFLGNSFQIYIQIFAPLKFRWAERMDLGMREKGGFVSFWLQHPVVLWEIMRPLYLSHMVWMGFALSLQQLQDIGQSETSSPRATLLGFSWVPLRVTFHGSLKTLNTFDHWGLWKVGNGLPHFYPQVRCIHISCKPITHCPE